MTEFEHKQYLEEQWAKRKLKNNKRKKQKTYIKNVVYDEVIKDITSE